MMDRIAHSMLRPAKSKLIPNGIDTDIFRPGDRAEARRALNLPANDAIVLMSGHSYFKPVDPLLEILRHPQLPDRRLTVVCIASSKAAEPPARDGIIHRPQQSDPQGMAMYYRAADVFPQIALAESFGKAIVESMACATPVVINTVGATPEIVTHMKTGMLTPGANATFDSRAFAEALKLLLTDRELHARISTAGAEEARSRFPLDRQVSAFIDWYEEVIADWKVWKRRA